MLFLKIPRSSFVHLFVKSSVVFENNQYGVFVALKSNILCKLLKKGKVKLFQVILKRM